jgi:hypothetical protein
VKARLTFAALLVLVPATAAEASFTQELGSPIPVAEPSDVVAADFNGDNRPDLAVANRPGAVTVLLRQPGGSFAAEGSPIPSGALTTAVAVADFDSDGRTDIATSNYDTDDLRVFLRNPTTGFTWEGNAEYPSGMPGSVLGADVTGDGQPDLIGGGYLSDATYVFKRNAGAGFTQEGLLYQGTGHRTDLAAADFNGDGRLDIASANYTNPAVAIMLRNAGNTGFSGPTDVTIGALARHLAVADFNRDGRADFAVTGESGGFVAVRLGNGDGTFTAEPNVPVGEVPYGIAAADFNNDGVADLAVANQGSKTISVLLRSGAGWVPDPSSPLPTGQTGANGLAAADFDGDGRVDIAVSNRDSASVTVLLNTTPPPAGPPGPPAPNLDADGDGVQTPADCNDANPAIKPGARDKPGDGIDQNCNGRDAKLPLLRRAISAVTATYPSGYLEFRTLSVRPVRKGDRIRLTCKGSGCKFKRKNIRVKKSAPRRSLMKHVRGMKLRRRAVVQLRVTRPGTIGRVKVVVARAPKVPKINDRCVRPGKKKLIRCPRP